MKYLQFSIKNIKLVMLILSHHYQMTTLEEVGFFHQLKLAVSAEEHFFLCEIRTEYTTLVSL